MIRVTIVEDNETIRYGLKEFISDTDDFVCTADYSNCEEMLAGLPENQTDIVLMDIDLPGISGIDGIKEIKKISPQQKIIILTIYAESENLFEALATGACGYLEKKTPPAQMLNTINAIYFGKSYMNTYIARKVVDYFNVNRRFLSEGKIDQSISVSEFKILKSLVSGNSPKAIANNFELPLESVYNNFYGIYQKLHIQYELKNPAAL